MSKKGKKKKQEVRKIISKVGRVYGNLEDKYPTGFYFNLLEVGSPDMRKGIFKVKNQLVTFRTIDEITEEDFPPQFGKITRRQLKNRFAKEPNQAFRILLHGWIKHFVEEKDFVLVGNVEEIKEEGWDSVPDNVKFQVSEV